MTHEEIISKVNMLNAEAERLNQIRQKNLGRKEALEKQLKDGIEAYNKKNNASLTVETIETELSKVEASLEQNIGKVEAIINAIESNDYNTAKSLTEGVVQSTEGIVQSTEKVEQFVENVEQSFEGVSQSIESVTPPIENVVQPVEDSVQQMENSIQQTETPTPTAEPVFPSPSPVSNPTSSVGNGVPYVQPVENPFMQGLTPPVASPTQIPEGSIFAQSFEKPVEPNVADDDVKPAPPPSFASLVQGSNFSS